MNNKDLLKAIGDIDDKYLIEENRVKSNNMVNIMKNMKLKYAFISTFVLVVVITGILVCNNTNKLEQNLSMGEVENDNSEMIIKIGEIKTIVDQVPLYGTEVNAIDIDVSRFEFLNEIKVPIDLTDVTHCAVYKKTTEETDFKFNFYLIEYSNKNKKISIAFSNEHEPTRRDVVFLNREQSKIRNTDVEISQYENMYIAKFNYNGTMFDISTDGITQDELIDLLTSVIK